MAKIVHFYMESAYLSTTIKPPQNLIKYKQDMFIFHVVTDESGKIYLWAKDSTLPRSQSKKQNLGEETTGEEKHPFAVDKLTLIDTLLHMGYGNAKTDLSTLTVYLPSNQKAPQPSPSIQEEDISVTTISLTPWLISAVEIDPRDALSILSHLSQEAGDYWGTSIEPGQTVHYWYAVCSVAESYVDSGRVAPHLAEQGESVIGVWRAFPSTAADINYIVELLDAMPPVTRSYVKVGAKYCGSSGSIVCSSRDVLTRTLDRLVNALSKERLSEDEADLTMDELDEIHQQWLRTLQKSGESIDANPEEIVELREQLDEWAHPG